MIKPQDLDLSAIPWLPLEHTSLFPNTSAIYIAFDASLEIKYIGRSSSCKKRWIKHEKYQELIKLGSINVGFLFAEPCLLATIESDFIQHFNPVLNLVGAYREKHPKDLSVTAFLGKEEMQWVQKLKEGFEDVPIERMIRHSDIPSITGIGMTQLRHYLNASLDSVDSSMHPKLVKQKGSAKFYHPRMINVIKEAIKEVNSTRYIRMAKTRKNRPQ